MSSYHPNGGQSSHCWMPSCTKKPRELYLDWGALRPSYFAIRDPFLNRCSFPFTEAYLSHVCCARAFAAPKRLRPRRRGEGERASKSEVAFARALSSL